MRFPLAVARAVREALGPDLIAGYRVTPFEAEADGYKLDDSGSNCVARLLLSVSTTFRSRSTTIA